jgi:hypothetical protein
MNTYAPLMSLEFAMVFYNLIANTLYTDGVLGVYDLNRAFHHNICRKSLLAGSEWKI